MGFLLECLREILPPHTIFHYTPPAPGDIASHPVGWEWETGQAASTPHFFSFVAALGWAGWWCGYCIHMHCMCCVYGISSVYYHTVLHIHSFAIIIIPHSIHLTIRFVLSPSYINVEISMFVLLRQLFR